MNKLLCTMLLALLSLPALGQAVKDRNLATIRRHGTQSTALPPRTSLNGSKDTNSQLDKLEHQTANTVIVPAAKTPKTPAYKLPAETHAATGSSYEQTMPVRGGIKNGAGAARSAPRPARTNLRTR